jgi:hypothetical protein
MDSDSSEASSKFNGFDSPKLTTSRVVIASIEINLVSVYTHNWYLAR